MIDRKILDAKRYAQLEKTDGADMKNFDVARPGEKLGYLELRDATDEKLITKIDRSKYPQILAKRYAVYQHPNGRIDAKITSYAKEQLMSRLQDMHNVGVRNFYIDVNAHGYDDGIYIGQDRIDPSFFTEMFNTYKDCTFTLNTIACHGGGMKNEMEKFQEKNKEGRVTVITQSKNDVSNTAYAIKENNNYNYDTLYNSILIRYLMQGYDAQYSGEKLTYGQAHLLADKETKLLTGHDAEVVRSGTNGSKYTADGSKDFRTENQA